MIEKKKYVCELCDTEYTDVHKCEECEQGHKIPKKIISSKYKAITVTPEGYPTKIVVEFKDGSQKYYYL